MPVQHAANKAISAGWGYYSALDLINTDKAITNAATHPPNSVYFRRIAEIFY